MYGKSDRYINCGIAEANMAGIAAGLSASGLKPYAHSFGPFASRRCYDQVFLSGGYAKNPFTMVGTDPGICATFNGGTHMPFEDVALYRNIPGSIICDCTDVVMLDSFLSQAKDLPGIKYIRVGRKESYPVYEEGTEFKVGKGNVAEEAVEFGDADIHEKQVNGIDLVYYYANEEYNGENYDTVTYIAEDGDYFIEIVFWLDGENAEIEADEILNSLHKLKNYARG